LLAADESAVQLAAVPVYHTGVRGPKYKCEAPIIWGLGGASPQRGPEAEPLVRGS